MSLNVLPKGPTVFATNRAEQLSVLLRFGDKVKSRGRSADFGYQRVMLLLQTIEWICVHIYIIIGIHVYDCITYVCILSICMCCYTGTHRF